MREQKIFLDMDMKKFENTLDNFFGSWVNDKNSRFLSWEHCYNFFKDNKDEILNDKTGKMLDLASLNLSFYLASWGMYRGSSNILWKDYKIHKELISTLLKEYSVLFNKNIAWEEIEKAIEKVKKYYKKLDITPTDTLITKVLLGIFACVPAYDEFFKKGIKHYDKNFSQRFNESSFKTLQDIANKIELKEKYKDYPPMRLVDAYFWWIGGGKQAYEKRAK